MEQRALRMHGKIWDTVGTDPRSHDRDRCRMVWNIRTGGGATCHLSYHKHTVISCTARLDITVVSTATLSSLLSELPYRYRKYRTLQGSVTFFIKSIVIRNKIYMVTSVTEPEPVGAGTFWSEPEPV